LRRGRVYRVEAYFRSRGALSVGMCYDNASAEAATVSLGKGLANAQYQAPSRFVTTMSGSGRFVAPSVTFQPDDAGDLEYHSLDLHVRLMSSRVKEVA
jgi:hypothetical protein